jgi:hypothetical protein
MIFKSTSVYQANSAMTSNQAERLEISFHHLRSRKKQSVLIIQKSVHFHIPRDVGPRRVAQNVNVNTSKRTARGEMEEISKRDSLLMQLDALSWEERQNWR